MNVVSCLFGCTQQNGFILGDKFKQTNEYYIFYFGGLEHYFPKQKVPILYFESFDYSSVLDTVHALTVAVSNILFSIIYSNHRDTYPVFQSACLVLYFCRVHLSLSVCLFAQRLSCIIIFIISCCFSSHRNFIKWVICWYVFWYCFPMPFSWPDFYILPSNILTFCGFCVSCLKFPRTNVFCPSPGTPFRGRALSCLGLAPSFSTGERSVLHYLNVDRLMHVVFLSFKAMWLKRQRA